jgi:hypothetical protein
MRFDDLMAMNMKITVIWDVIPRIHLFILLFNMIYIMTLSVSQTL